jgi:beta-galactosidase
VAWNWHEQDEGAIHGLGNVTGFLDAANATGMLVIFRPGPYICGEWEMGGLPAWLLTKQGLKLRTSVT